MHGRALCDIYKLKKELPGVCGKEAIKLIRIFNSGVMLLSQAHRPYFDGYLCPPPNLRPLPVAAATAAAWCITARVFHAWTAATKSRRGGACPSSRTHQV